MITGRRLFATTHLIQGLLKQNKKQKTKNKKTQNKTGEVGHLWGSLLKQGCSRDEQW